MCFNELMQMLRDTKNSDCLYIIASTAITYAMTLFKGITSKYLAANLSHDFLGKKLLNIFAYIIYMQLCLKKIQYHLNCCIVQMVLALKLMAGSPTVFKSYALFLKSFGI